MGVGFGMRMGRGKAEQSRGKQRSGLGEVSSLSHPDAEEVRSI